MTELSLYVNIIIKGGDKVDLSDRIRIILSENNLKQKELANTIGVTESYISAIINRRTSNNLSQSLAKLIEEKYGYNSQWILLGIEPKLRQTSNKPLLSDLHKKAIMHIEKMDNEQIKAVLAFMDSLEEIEKIIRNIL